MPVGLPIGMLDARYVNIDTDTMTGTLTLPNTGLHLLDTDDSHDLIISPGSDLTADRTLSIATGDSDRTLTLDENLTASNFLKKDGSVALTADWDIGDGRKIEVDAVWARDGDGLALYDDAGNGIFVEDGGQVGIGTASPERLLSLEQNVNAFTQPALKIRNINSGSSAQTRFDIYNNSGDTAGTDGFAFFLTSTTFGGGYENSAGFWMHENGPVVFATNNSERVRIDASGNVGINTTGPDRKLDVLDASNPQLRLTHTDGSVYVDFQAESDGDLSIELSGSNINIIDKDILLGTTTGSKIGTAAAQKIGLWGVTPVIQQAHIIDADGNLADITTKFNTLLSQLEATGILAAA